VDAAHWLPSLLFMPDAYFLEQPFSEKHKSSMVIWLSGLHILQWGCIKENVYAVEVQVCDN
jgi:hypothetical protein